MTGGPASDFDSHLAQEIVHSERLRTGILAVVFAVIAGLVCLFTWLYRESAVPFLRSPVLFAQILALMGGLICYELFVRAALGRMQRRGTSPPTALRYLNALIETSMPTILMHD